jgi:hypothetical protein
MDRYFRPDLISRARNSGEEVVNHGLHQMSQKWSEAMDLLNCSSPHFDSQQPPSRFQFRAHDCFSSYLSQKTRTMNKHSSESSDLDLRAPYEILSRKKSADRNDGQVDEYSKNKNIKDILCKDYTTYSPNEVHSEMIGYGDTKQFTRTFDFQILDDSSLISLSRGGEEKGDELRYISSDDSDNDSQSIDLEDANRQIQHFRAIMEKRQQNRFLEEDKCDSIQEHESDDDDAVFETIQKIRIYDNFDEKPATLDAHVESQCGRILYGISGNAVSLPPDFYFTADPSPFSIKHETNQNVEGDGSYVSVKSKDDLSAPSQENKNDDQMPQSPPASEATTALAGNASYARDLLLRSTQVLRTCPSDEDLRRESKRDVATRVPISPTSRSLMQCPFDEDVAWNSDWFDKPSSPARTTDTTNRLNSILSRLPAFLTKANALDRSFPEETKDTVNAYKSSPGGSSDPPSRSSAGLSSMLAGDYHKLSEQRIDTVTPISYTRTANSSDISPPQLLGRSHIKEMALSRIRSRDADRLRQTFAC